MNHSVSGAYYNLVVLMRPGVPQSEIDEVVQDVKSVLGEAGEVYRVEHELRDLRYKIKGCLSCTILSICCVMQQTIVATLSNKMRYHSKVLRHIILSEKEKSELPRLGEAPVSSLKVLNPLNPNLSQHTTELGRILPSRITKFGPKVQRAVARRIKTARSLGLLTL